MNHRNIKIDNKNIVFEYANLIKLSDLLEFDKHVEGAYKLAKASLQAINKNQNAEYFEDIFGDASLVKRRTVAASYSAILDKMENTKLRIIRSKRFITKSKEMRADVFSSANIEDGKTISVFDAFFKHREGDEKNLYDRSSVVMHEVAHLVGLTKEVDSDSVNSAECLRNFSLLSCGIVKPRDLFVDINTAPKEKTSYKYRIGIDDSLPFDPNQPRDKIGRWCETGAENSGKSESENSEKSHQENSDGIENLPEKIGDKNSKIENAILESELNAEGIGADGAVETLVAENPNFSDKLNDIKNFLKELKDKLGNQIGFGGKDKKFDGIPHKDLDKFIKNLEEMNGQPSDAIARDGISEKIQAISNNPEKQNLSTAEETTPEISESAGENKNIKGEMYDEPTAEELKKLEEREKALVAKEKAAYEIAKKNMEDYKEALKKWKAGGKKGPAPTLATSQEEKDYIQAVREKYKGFVDEVTPEQAMQVINDACNTLAEATGGNHYNTEQAKLLLLGTAATESDFRARIQDGGGPAIGLFQMEYRTFQDIYQNDTGAKHIDKCIKALEDEYNEGERITYEDLLKNERIAAGFARLKYSLNEKPIPNAKDRSALAKYWKSVYNTAGGKGKPEVFLDRLQKAENKIKENKSRK